MKKTIYHLVLILTVIAIILSSGIYISYYHIDITDYTVESDTISAPIHIAMIGDVHDEHCKVKSKVVETIRELSPDLILCVGDIIDDDSTSDESTISFLSSLVSIAPVYMSLGNQEEEYYQNHPEDYCHIEQTGVTLLEEKYLDLNINGNVLRLGGMYNYAFSLGNGRIDGKSMQYNSAYTFLTDFTNTSDFKLLMAHRPDSFIFGYAYNWDIDLVASAHYHGGQVRLPYYGGLYAPELGWFPKYTEGIYELGKMKMLLTRGISSSSELFPRFNNPCEIIDLTIK